MNEPRSVFETPLLQRIYDHIREERDPGFSFFSGETIPWAGPVASLADTRVAIVSSGAFHEKGDAPFECLESLFGDTSFRVIPHGSGNVDLDAPYVDQKYAVHDLEVALPMKALDGLHAERRIGPPAPRHFSFCGGIVHPLPGLHESAARVGRILREDGVGAVVLLPTCSLCVQTISVVARELESLGIRTVAVSLIPELSRIVGTPRTVSVHFPFGAPCGNPGHAELHRAVLLEALSMLEDAREPGEVRASNNAWRKSPAGPEA